MPRRRLLGQLFPSSLLPVSLAVAAMLWFASHWFEVYSWAFCAISWPPGPRCFRGRERLLADRVASAQLHFDTVRAAYQAQTVTFGVLLESAGQLLTAVLAAARDDEARLAARRRYLEAARQIEAKVTTLYNIGARGGEAEKYHSARMIRQAAEIGLLRQQLGLPPEPELDR